MSIKKLITGLTLSLLLASGVASAAVTLGEWESELPSNDPTYAEFKLTRLITLD